MICPHCKKSTALKDYDPDEYKRRKIDNAKKSTDKMKANGNKPGPRRSRPDRYIKRLRDKGYSYRKIGKILGISPTTVSNSIKEQDHE